MGRVRVFESLIFIAFFIFLAGTYAYAGSSDFQYRNINSVTWKVSKDWKLSLTEEVYFKDDASDFYYEHTELGILYSGFFKWLDVSLNFRHALTESPSNKWKKEEQPGFHATFKFKIKDYDFSDRNRFEYRIREDSDDFWRYRNMVTMRFPLKLTRYNIQPYLSDEFFVDFDKEELNENRAYAGLSFKLSKNWGADLYYLWRRVKSGDKWTTNNILGTRLKLEF